MLCIHASTEPRKLATISAMATIRLVLATTPLSATAACPGAPHRRLSAKYKGTNREACVSTRICQGASSTRASQGVAAIPPARMIAIDA